MAKKKKKNDKAKKKSGFKSIALLTIISLSCIIFMQMTFVLLIVGLLPTVVVHFVDNSKGRSLFHTVLACNLAGVLPHVGQLLAGGNEIGMVQGMLGDMGVLLMMYSSAALGWILMSVSPYAARLLITSINSNNVLRLKNSQNRLKQEWGEDISHQHMD